MEWIKNLLDQSEKSWGGTHLDLQEVLEKNITDIKIGAEIGVAFGSNSYKLLSKFENLFLYSIDPYIEYSDSDLMSDNVKGQNGNEVFEFVSNRLKSNFENRSKLVRSTSEFLLDNFEDETFDFIFIDGDHSYEGVKRDLQNTYKKVRKGGIICGDDYNLIGGVNLAVDEFFQNEGLEINIKNLVWWIEKR